MVCVTRSCQSIIHAQNKNLNGCDDRQDNILRFDLSRQQQGLYLTKTYYYKHGTTTTKVEGSKGCMLTSTRRRKTNEYRPSYQKKAHGKTTKTIVKHKIHMMISEILSITIKTWQISRTQRISYSRGFILMGPFGL